MPNSQGIFVIIVNRFIDKFKNEYWRQLLIKLYVKHARAVDLFPYKCLPIYKNTGIIYLKKQ